MVLSRQAQRYFWRRWTGTIALTIYKKLFAPPGATSDPYTPPILCPWCRERPASFKETMKYGPLIGLERSKIFEIPDAPPACVATRILLRAARRRGTRR